jgi:hypothetical protein
MKFSTSRLTSDRVINVASRTTVTQADDTQLLQELALNLWAGEQQITLEVAHDYGHVSVPQPGNADGPAAEAFVVFLNGNRSHGVVLKTADRRYRLGKMQPGEVGMHDDQTHQRVIHRGGIYDSAPNSKLHQQRVQKPGDSVLGGLIQLLSGGVFGQTPWLPKIPFSYKHHDANVQQHQHPKTINHHIINGDAIPPASGGASALPQAIGQIAGMVSQLSTMVTAGVGLPGVNSIASAINTATTALSTLPGYDTNVAALAAEIAATSSTIAGMNTFTGMSMLVTQLNSLVSQLSGMAGGGTSQIIHAHSLDQVVIQGILASAFQGQHTTTHASNGVTHTSVAKVSSNAPIIPHNGQIYGSDNFYLSADYYGAAYLPDSDERLKSNRKPLPPVLAILRALEIELFDKKRVHRSDDGKASIHSDPPRPSLGFRAQYLRGKLPKFLQFLVRGDESKEFLSVEESKFGILAIKALQEYADAADATIAKLTVRVAELEGRHA